MADQALDTRMDTLLREVLATEVASLPMTVTPARIMERAATGRRGSAKTSLRGIFRWPTFDLRRVSVALGSAAVVVAGALALNYVVNQQGLGGPLSPDDPRRPFLGVWVSTSDSDGTQTMTVDPSADGGVTLVVLDTVASVCSGTTSTMTGAGSVDGNNLVIPTPDYKCDDGSEPRLASGDLTPLNEILRNLTYIRDPERNILVVGGTSVWHRPNAPDVTPGPSDESSPTGSPSESPSTQPSAPPSPRPSPRPGDSRFSSAIHGISIDYPSGWQTRPATEAWNQDALTFDAPDVDVLYDPTHQADLYVALVSEPLGGRSADDWCCGPLWTAAEICVEGGGTYGRWTVDGARGAIRSCGTRPHVVSEHVVSVATATHGYVIYVVVGDDPVLQATYNADWFEALLETVELEPAEEPDPAASPRPSPEAGFSRFTSATHGITMDYPDAWQIRQAIEPWKHDAVTFDSPGADVIFDPGAQGGLYLAVVSEALDGQPGDEWCCGEAITAADVCNNGSGFGRITLNGARGWIMDCKFDAPTSQILSVATATRGYVIVLRVPDEPRYANYGYLSDWFERLVETIEFRPEDALGAPSAP